MRQEQAWPTITISVLPQDEHVRASRPFAVRADVTRLQRGFHVVAMRLRSHELNFYSRFCSTTPPPPPRPLILDHQPPSVFLLFKMKISQVLHSFLFFFCNEKI